MLKRENKIRFDPPFLDKLNNQLIAFKAGVKI